MRKVQKAKGDILSRWMAFYGLKRRWYEFDLLARWRLNRHLKRNNFFYGC